MIGVRVGLHGSTFRTRLNRPKEVGLSRFSGWPGPGLSCFHYPDSSMYYAFTALYTDEKGLSREKVKVSSCSRSGSQRANSQLGEKKLAKVIVPDKWKEGASNTTEGGGRKINENKLLSKKNRWTPYGTTKCIICKQQVHQDGKYCHTCAYTKGGIIPSSDLLCIITLA
ncbi:hypothetical protein L1049_010537 [Liquidambar formosana]|uniref:Cysteine-rich PDZ-binding protein n=1 Tax=Liquidambar formosana TaxID=63359 RepID=A0AAP0N7R0_LIQFO